MTALRGFPFSLSLPRAVCVATVIGSIAAAACASEPRRICFKDACVSLEVAHTPQAREAGLMFRTALGADSGMLFVFGEPARHAFWMKNTRIPLDIIWLDRDLRVVDMKTHVPPCVTPVCPSFEPRAEASFVLEVNAGFADAHAIRVGDTAVLRDE